MGNTWIGCQRMEAIKRQRKAVKDSALVNDSPSGFANMWSHRGQTLSSGPYLIEKASPVPLVSDRDTAIHGLAESAVGTVSTHLCKLNCPH